MKNLLILLAIFVSVTQAQLMTRVYKVEIDEETGEEISSEEVQENMCWEFTWVGPVEDITNDTIAQSCDIYDSLVRRLICFNFLSISANNL